MHLKRVSYRILLLIFMFLSACGPRSLEDFKEEGEGVIRSLIQDLRKIKTREELAASTVKLKRHFERLVDVMIAGQDYRLAHPVSHAMTEPNHELNEQLRKELSRIYQLDGGRQIVEKCQETSLHRLDVYAKRKNLLNGSR